MALLLSYQKLSQAFFLYDSSHIIYSVKTTEYNSIVGVIPKEILTGLVPAKQSFSMTMKKILRPVFA